MGLTDLWLSSQEQLKDKHIQQIIAFAGQGRLLDGSAASTELRTFLAQVSSMLLSRYANECLTDSFNGSGHALQDVVNQVGRRLGFEVTYGRYRGTSSHIGFDGLWRLPKGHVIIIEVKTTDAFRIDLNTLEEYRRKLIEEHTVSPGQSSILVVVGRQDTGDLEAQIRGSRQAWDVRLISLEALLRLMALKEEVEDPKIVNRIHDILIPREFTRLDEIVDIVFSTAEDIKQEEPPESGADDEVEDEVKKPKFIPVAFNQACVDRIAAHLGVSLVKQSRVAYSTADGKTGIICAVSKEHTKGGQTSYWFAFHPHQKEFLEAGAHSYVAFGCGSEDTLLLIPFSQFTEWLDGMNVTSREDRFYWHVSIFREGESFVLHRRKGHPKVHLSKFSLA